MKLLLLLFFLAGLVAVIFVVVARRRSRKKLTALVFLLKAPRPLEEEQVRAKLSDALGFHLGTPEHGSANWLMKAPVEQIMPTLEDPTATSFMVSAEGRSFLVNALGVPYMKDPEQFAEGIPDLRLRQAVAGHRAWLSVDLFGEHPAPEERAEIYAALGRMLAEFAGEDCLAVYCPELGRCNEYGPEVVASLRSGEPLALFDEPTFAPVVQVDSSDPAMKAAVEEARRRWPEFVAGFQQNTDREKPFAVKARFSDGEHEEFMWVEVQQLEGEHIIGRLANSPAQLQHVHEGDTVTVELKDLNDWICEIGGEAQGGFTLKVMGEALKQ